MNKNNEHLCVFVLSFILFASVKGEGDVSYPNLHLAIADVVRADSIRDAVIFYDKQFEQTVLRLAFRLFRMQCTVTLFQSNDDSSTYHFKDPKLIMNYLQGFSDEFRNILTVNLLSENASFAWLNTLIKLPILKRPNKHVFMFDVEKAADEAFHQWPDEVVAAVLLTSLNETTNDVNVIQYFNLPCNVDEPIRTTPTKCRHVWFPGKYTSKEERRKTYTPTYTIAIIHVDERVPYGHGIGIENFEVRLLHYLAKALRFNWKFLYLNSTSWGRQLEDGTWDGLTGAVFNGEADMAFCQITITAERMKVVDFSRPYLIEPIVILSKAPGIPSSRYLVFKPFTLTVWIALVFIVIFSGVSFVAMIGVHLMIDSSGDNSRNPLESAVKKSKLKATVMCIFHAYRTFFGHAVWEMPQRMSVRMYILLLTTLGMTMTVMYSTRLIMLMTHRTVESSIDTLEDLLLDVENGNRFILRKNAYLTSMFENYEDEPSIYNKIHKAAKSAGGLEYIYHEREYVNVMRDIGENGGTVVRNWSDVLKFLGSIDNSHKYHVSSEMFSKNLIGIAMKRGFRLKNEINAMIDLLESRGILEQWYKWSLALDDLKASQSRQSAEPASSSVIRHGDLAGAWVFYATGLFMSVIAFVAENAYAWRKKWRVRNE